MNQAYQAVLFTFLVQAIAIRAIPSFFLPSDLVASKVPGVLLPKL